MKNVLKNSILYLFLGLIFGQNYAVALEFKDVPRNFWAYEEINYVTNEKFLDGISKNYFMPNKLLTKAEYCAMLIKAMEQQDTPIETMYSYDDINHNHWAWEYVLAAINLDIVPDTGERYFYPNQFITRTEMITFLVNLLKTEEISKQDAIKALQNYYTDFDDIPDWFKITAGKAEYIDVIAKEPPREHYLDYDKYVTRAQAAVFISKMKREIDSYLMDKIKQETSPKFGEGIVVENVLINDDVVTLPAKTVLPIMIMGQLSSKESKAGEMFQARFANNIVDYEHHILLSKDIVLIGKILDTTRSRNFVRNGELIFELSSANKHDLYTRILAYAECEAPKVEANKFKKAMSAMVKGREFIIKDGQILYIKLYKPLRVNIVTGEILD